MLRVERMKLTGIGPFEEAEFNFPAPEGDGGSLVLFEGPNGSGKTTIAETLALAFGTRKTEYVNPAIPLEKIFTSNFKGLSYRIRREDYAILVQFTGDNTRGQCRVTRYGVFTGSDGPQTTPSSDPTPANKRFVHTARGHQSSPILETAGPRDLSESHDQGALSFGVLSAGAYFGQFLTNIENERVRAKLYAIENADSPMLQRAESHARSIQRIETALSALLDRIVKISFSIGQHAPHITFDGEDIPLDQLGEGLRSSFAWMADLLVRLERHPWTDTSVAPTEQPFTLILDEVDEGLHPAMQMRLMPTLRSLFPRANIYATTHSPFVVASAGNGVVFPLRPGRDHRVRGEVKAVPLKPGQSLSWVVEEVFRVPSEFIDTRSRDALELHRIAVDDVQAGRAVDWLAFQAAREFLLALNEETRSIVTFRELPVREAIHRGLFDLAKPAA